MLGNYDKCKVCGDYGIFNNNICDDCLAEKLTDKEGYSSPYEVE